jgi:mono/diheme cytochrome c family protein
MNAKNTLMRLLARRPLSRLVMLGLGLGACSGSSGDTTVPDYRIVSRSGGLLQGVAGDALALKVVVVEPDGSTQDLPAGANAAWILPDLVTTLPAGSTAQSPLPFAGDQPIAARIDNARRPDRSADLAGVVFLLDPGIAQNGTVKVSAVLSGVTPPATVTASIGVDPTPVGDWMRGATLYGATCASCHGTTGHGSPGAPSAATYLMDGGTYDFPAPGLNAEPGNLASDPDYDAALLAVAARADMDNGGVALRLPMPDWLSQLNPADGQPLSTQDLADVYAFLKTQTH